MTCPIVVAVTGTGFGEADVVDKPFLDRVDVGAIGNVAKETVSRNLQRSKPGQRYAEDPFPAPDSDPDGKRLWWRLERRKEIAAWFRRHKEIKGGRPPKPADG